jgi:hypothetical protein
MPRPRLPRPPRRRRLLALAIAPLLPLTALAAPTATSATAPESSVRLTVPDRVEAWARGTRSARVHLGAALTAGSSALEVRSHRTRYDRPVTAEYLSPAGSVPLGEMSGLDRLNGFLRVRVTDLRTGAVSGLSRAACLNSWSAQRARPDAPLRSPYPSGCWANPYALGMVQGIQAGWTAPMDRVGMRLPVGRYDLRVSIAKRYREALGVSWADGHDTVRVVVRQGTDPDHEFEYSMRSVEPASDDPAPVSSEPTGPQMRTTTGPLPNLRSFPAWGISAHGEKLRFAATVWNGGDSPLLVDGFREPDSDTMDAYQYFLDADGNQVGYQQVGAFAFNHHGSHDHWHFRGFAAYRLLDADGNRVVRSKKASFCLANTDAGDLTVPGAQWRPENSDLDTDCGWESATSMRQVLASGWGDTYHQYRAGQAFDLTGLPNGWYRIAVVANPGRSLVESDTSDNRRLRRVWIGGRPGARTVRVPQVGMVDERWLF